MNISIQIQVCRACLKPPETIKLTEYSSDSEIMKNYYDILSIEATPGLPKTFCEKCVSKIKLLTSFRKSSRNSENYLKSFVVKINQEFAKSLPTVGSSSVNDASSAEDDAELDQMLYDEQDGSSPIAAQAPVQPAQPSKPPVQHIPQAKIIKSSPDKMKKAEKVKQQIVKIEKMLEPKEEVVESGSGSSDKADKEYLEMESAIYNDEEEEQLDDDGNMFGEEIYDIMEIDQEGENENIYLDDTGKPVLGHHDEDGEFILVNFKSSNEDLSEREQQQFVVEELYDDESPAPKPISRKKHVNRMPRDIINKYAQSTDNNQHICTKCVKVFSTRTNLIRHIQSHDGYKAYVCNICQKGFTQSGSLKQHMYIHSGERPYKCQYCERAFTQGKTLKFHIRRHTEEKPFICTECNSSFRQRDGLKRHLKSRHNIELVYERPNQMDEKILANISGDKSKSFSSETADDSKNEVEMLEGDEDKKELEQDL